MDFNTLVSNRSINDLKCSLCGNYLSYFPIFISITDRNICGRCEVPQDGTCIRNKVYEALAEDVLFPCRYVNQGCIEKLYARDIGNHEDHCPVRLVKCPGFYLNLCNEDVSLPLLRKHCEFIHSDLILLNGKFKMDLSESGENNNIIVRDKDFILFNRILDAPNNKLTCTLLCVEAEQIQTPEKYKLSLENENRSISVSGHLNNKPTDICLNILKDSPDDTIVEGKLTVGEPPTAAPSKSELEQEVLKILKCSSCAKYIKPPVNFYFEDHKILCLACSGSRGYPAKDYGFNNLALKLFYPCEFEPNGCSYITQPVFLKEHELYCLYGNDSCPVAKYVKCSWSGLRNDLIAHVNKEHGTLMATMSVFAVQICDQNKYYDCSISRIIKFAKYLFLLRFSAHGKNYIWNVQIIGEFQENFKYELEVFNKNDMSKKLVTVQPCLPLTNETQEARDMTGYCYFQLGQVHHLIADFRMTFRVRIFK